MTAFKFGTTNSRYVTGVAFSDGTKAADSLTVDASGYLISLNDHAVVLDRDGAWNVNIQGAVVSKNGQGVLVQGGGSSALTLTVGADGFISSTEYAVNAQSTGATTITNAGTIVSENAQGIITFGKTTITNTGMIEGNFYAIQSFFGATTVNNKGTILGQIYAGGDAKHSIANSGYISSVITLGDFDDILSNSGECEGDILFGLGNNKLTNTGTLDGDCTFGSGNDSVTTSGLALGVFLLGDGNNIFKNSSSVYSEVTFGSGNDSFSNTGTKAYLDDNVTMGGGKNLISNGGIIVGNVTAGSGDDTFSNVGALSRVDGIVQLGSGLNKFTNAGQVKGTVSAGGDADTLTNSGNLGTVQLGDGNDKVNNSGFIQSLDVGAGDDTVINSGLIGSTPLSLGDGNDKYTGGALSDFVGDSNGTDITALGAGDDDYFAVGAAASKDGADKIDGGAGSDRYDASAAPGGVKINLDTVDHAEPLAAAGLTAKNSASLKVVSPIFTGDAIVGFEEVTGSSDGDWIYGNAAVNSLSGENGNDVLAGYAGNDRLHGGAGVDSLFGGAGSDELYGGIDQDNFMYTAAADSLVGLGKRDVIQDFTDGTDQIRIYFDGNTKVAGIQGFDYLNQNLGGTANTNFTGQAGQLRTIWTLDGYLIEGDVNGDAKPDFQIEVLNSAHNISWNAIQSDYFALV
jgi:hypothetical protein